MEGRFALHLCSLIPLRALSDPGRLHAFSSAAMHARTSADQMALVALELILRDAASKSAGDAALPLELETPSHSLFASLDKPALVSVCRASRNVTLTMSWLLFIAAVESVCVLSWFT
jgi:hypothetical protein